VIKSILVPINFSRASNHAAYYALHIARQIKANIILCHVLHKSEHVPTTSSDSWTGDEPPTAKNESTERLEEVAFILRNKVSDFSMPDAFQPQVTCIAKAGEATNVINLIAKKEKAHLIIMGMTGAGTATRLLFGSVSQSMIDTTHIPLILVPEEFFFNKLEKIGFATTLQLDDIKVIQTLANFAESFSADILIAYVSVKSELNSEAQKEFDHFLKQVTSKINYDKIFFQRVDKVSINKGLNWFLKHELIDLLVMVQHFDSMHHTLFSNHTHTQANHLQVPLLIMPTGLHSNF